MAKTQTQFVCQQCGRISPRPLGRCPQCGSWDSMVEEILAPAPAAAGAHALASRGLSGGISTPRRIGEIEGDVEERLALPIGEFARVLGGGVVPGSIVLVGGDPGIGKSTLVLQVAVEMARQPDRCCMFPAKNPSGRSRCAPCAWPAARKAAPRGRFRRPLPGHRNQPGRDPGARQPGAPRPADHRLDPDSLPARAGIERRVGLAGARVRLRGCASWPNPAVWPFS